MKGCAWKKGGKNWVVAWFSFQPAPQKEIFSTVVDVSKKYGQGQHRVKLMSSQAKSASFSDNRFSLKSRQNKVLVVSREMEEGRAAKKSCEEDSRIRTGESKVRSGVHK